MRLQESKTIFTALADETRLRILNLLAQGELCVCDLIKVLRLAQPKVSRHLAYLRRAGLVQARKEGLWMHYRLSETGTKVVRAMMAAFGEGEKAPQELCCDLKEYRKQKKCLVGCCG